jgi:hypothetical protein
MFRSLVAAAALSVVALTSFQAAAAPSKMIVNPHLTCEIKLDVTKMHTVVTNTTARTIKEGSKIKLAFYVGVIRYVRIATVYRDVRPHDSITFKSLSYAKYCTASLYKNGGVYKNAGVYKKVVVKHVAK